MEPTKLFVVISILLTEFCERITYYGITSNMVLYLQTFLDYPTQASITINLAFTGIAYFIPSFCGWLSDTTLGRFNAIYLSFLVYLVGSISLTVTAFDYVEHFGNGYQMTLVEKRIFYLFGLGLLSIGTGGIKTNVSPFGAHQLITEGQTTVQTFFNWFYWFINLGAAFALSLIAYIQQNISFFIGYVIPTTCVMLSLVVFMIPRRYYVHEETDIGVSAFNELFHVPIEGVRRKYRTQVKLRSFLDYARFKNGGSFSDESVDDFIFVGRMLPVFMCLIMFWTIYSQVQSTFLVQAEHLDARFSGILLPIASLSIFSTISVLICTPLVDRIVYPFIQRLKDGVPPSRITRMGFGMVLVSLATVAAGIVEIVRKNDIAAHGAIIQTLPGSLSSFNASSVSVLLQIPQFTLIGLGEVFTGITALEFAFADAPGRIKGVIMGISLCTVGVGAFLGSALVSIVAAASKPYSWISDDMNDGHYEYFFFLLSGIMIINIIIFVPVGRWYELKKHDHQPCEDNASECYINYDELP